MDKQLYQRGETDVILHMPEGGQCYAVELPLSGHVGRPWPTAAGTAADVRSALESDGFHAVTETFGLTGIAGSAGGGIRRWP